MNTTETPSQAANAVSTTLATLLGDSYSLMSQTHLAHWNVEGPAFFELHGAFQKQYEELFEAVDEIAERLRALDVYAPGGLQTLAGLSSIAQLPQGRNAAKDFVAGLTDGHETVVASAGAAREAAGKAEDLETQDLCIKRIQTHEKTLWMLKSYLKNL